jgi:hypothetical protein
LGSYPNNVLLGIHQRPLRSHCNIAPGHASNADQPILVADNSGATEAHDLSSLDNL